MTKSKTSKARSFARRTSVALYRAKHAAGERFLRSIAAVDAEFQRASSGSPFTSSEILLTPYRLHPMCKSATCASLFRPELDEEPRAICERAIGNPRQHSPFDPAEAGPRLGGIGELGPGSPLSRGRTGRAHRPLWQTKLKLSIGRTKPKFRLWQNQTKIDGIATRVCAASNSAHRLKPCARMDLGLGEH